MLCFFYSGFFKHLTVQARKRPNSQPYFTTTAHRNDGYAQDDLLIYTSCSCVKHATKTLGFNFVCFHPNPGCTQTTPVLWYLITADTNTASEKNTAIQRSVKVQRQSIILFSAFTGNYEEKKKKERMCHLFNDFRG